MECVKDIFLNSFPHPKKAITYQHEEIPSNAEIIGNLSVSSEYDGGISGIIRKAAKVGANGYKILETNQVPLQGVRPGACASCKWETYTYVSYIYRAVLFYIPEKIEN
jgi:hypothetical protein